MKRKNLTITREELDSHDLPMMLRLAENATKYAGEIIGGGQKTPTEYQTQKRWKTYWDDGSHKWNYDHHFDDDYD